MKKLNLELYFDENLSVKRNGERLKRFQVKNYQDEELDFYTKFKDYYHFKGEIKAFNNNKILVEVKEIIKKNMDFYL